MRFSAWVTAWVTIASAVILAATLPAGAEQAYLVSLDDDDTLYIVLDLNTAAPAGAIQFYVVAPNDTLYGIARHFGVSIDRLAEMNGLRNPELVRAGMILVIPDSAHAGGVSRAPAPSLGKRASYRTYTYYTVRPGDTLSDLARTYHVTVAALATANSLGSPDNIRVGQILRIPGPSASPHETPAAKPLPSPSRFPNPQARDLLIRRITTAAQEFVGTPYVWGGTSRSGVDCSGLVYSLYSPYEPNLPRTSYGQFTVGSSVTRADLAPGDLVFFDTDGSGASHVGIYIGDGQFVTVSSSAGRAVIARLDNPYWAYHYIGARRIF